MARSCDANTTGLVLATDDGRWYPPSKFAAGFALQGEFGLTRPAQLKILSPNKFLLTISEGMFHQVKRMFATSVIKLTPNDDIGVDLNFAIIA